MESNTNQLPASLDAEKSIISSIIQDPANNLDRAIELGVTEDWFHGYGNRAMWGHLSTMATSGQSLDLVSLTQNLIDSGIAAKIGGPAAITELYSFATNSANFEAHIEMIKTKYAARMILEVASRTTERAYSVSDGESLQETLETLSEPVSAIYELVNGKSNRAVAKVLVRDWLEAYKRRMKGEETTTIPCRMSGLERLYGGLITPAYMIVTALPSSGKTAFLTQITNGVCEAGYKAMSFTMEMTKEKLMDRALINESGLHGDVITKPHLFKPSKGNLINIKHAAERLAGFDLVVHEEPAMHVDKLCALARSEHRRSPITLIGIDYAQLMKGDRQKGDTLETMYADISHKLQALQKELKCTIIILSQTSIDQQGNVSTKYAKVFEDDADLWLHIIRQKGQEDVEDVVVMKCRHHGHNSKKLGMTLNKPTQMFIDIPYDRGNRN
jgi:replicative DNA helicase